MTENKNHGPVEIDHARLVAFTALRAVVGEEEAGLFVAMVVGVIHGVFTVEGTGGGETGWMDARPSIHGCARTHARNSPAVGHRRDFADGGGEEVGGGPMVHLHIRSAMIGR